MPAPAMIARAVIPAAGQGTRMQPLSCAVPKELLPVGDVPMIHYAVCEAIAAGVREIYVVINRRQKQPIEDFYRRSDWRTGEWSGLTGADECDLLFLDQPNPLGIVDAVDKAKEYLADEPFFLLMPDDVFYAEIPACVQLRDAFLQQPRNLLGLTRVTRETAGTFSDSGGVELKPLEDRVFLVTALLDKSQATLELGTTDQALRVCGRYILTHEFFDEAANIAPDELARKDEIPVLRRLSAKERILGLALDGERFDCGNWQGYWAANRAWMHRRGLLD